jgi:class 3 adenylate cyclase
MSELPSGTVTFLFSDIEGSTRLMHELGDRWGDVLADHRRVLRERFGASGGREVDTQGDAFFFVFARAREGVQAASEAQQALAAHAWPEDTEVRVRMGLHTGEPAVGDEGYVGLDVVRAARICAAAHGGQVLVSETTKALVPEAEFRDLGEHRLKDLERGVRLYQLVVPGRPAEFPALRTEAPVSALAAPGRELELARQAEEAANQITASVEESVAKLLSGIPGAGFDPLAGAPPPAPPTPQPPRRSRLGRLFRRAR